MTSDIDQPASERTIRSGTYWCGLGFAMLFPSVLTGTYFVLLAGFPSDVQQSVYFVGKCLQFGFPVAWVFLFLREKPRWHRRGLQGVGWGLGFGSFVLLAMGGLYIVWLKSSGLLGGLEQQAIQKVRDMGLDSVGRYAATGVFYSLAHSLLEEYYWRWFVFGQLQPRIGRGAAVLVSSLGFMAHHVILLGTFFGWDSPLAYLFSLGVALGGAVWAWIYASSRSLLGPWLSHMLIDVTIFLIGFDLVKAALK